MKRIVLGSTAFIKAMAVTTACRELGMQLDIRTVKTNSGVNLQPFGFKETLQGATARASQAKTAHPDAIAIGIENGLFQFNKSSRVIMDMAVIYIIDASGRPFVTTSSGINIPWSYVAETKRIGFNRTTIGEVIAKELGGNAQDPHFNLTDGRIGRSEILANGVKIALSIALSMEGK